MPLAEFEAEPQARLSAGPRCDCLALAESPLSLIYGLFSERRESVKGAPVLRCLRTLDGFPPFCILGFEGKGAGSQGLAPGGVLRQSLMRASSAPPLPLPSLSLSLQSDSSLDDSSAGGLPARLVAMLPSALFWLPSLPVPAGVLISRGAAISVTNCRAPLSRFPTFCRDLAVTPTRRFRILRRFSILFHPTASRFRSLLEFAV